MKPRMKFPGEIGAGVAATANAGSLGVTAMRRVVLALDVADPRPHAAPLLFHLVYLLDP